MDFCSEEQVASVFNQIIGEGMVSKVITLRKKNNHTGVPFKIFFIEFAKSNTILDGLLIDINADPEPDVNKRHTKIIYDAQDHFWKVSLARKKDKEEKEEKKEFVPRILKREPGEV